MDDDDDHAMPVAAFLNSTWLDVGADGIKTVIITPERAAQRDRMVALLASVAPASIGPDGAAHYPLFRLALAWLECRCGSVSPRLPMESET